MDDNERLTPNGLAEICEGLLPDLLAQRKAAKTDAERNALSARIKSTRILLSFARTRARYVPKGRRTR